MGSQKPQDVALIGCGAIMELAHVPALITLAGQYRIRAVADPVPGRRDLLGDRLGVPAAARFGSVAHLAGEVSPQTLAVVAVPTPAAAATISALSAAGLPVLAEKPVALSAASARTLATGDIRVVHNYLCRAEVQQALRLVGQGTIGAPRFIRLEQPDPGHFPGRGEQPDWRRRGAAGCLLDNAYHWVYVAEALAASPVHTVTAQSAAPEPGIAAEDVAVLVLRHHSEVLTCVQTAWCAAAAEPVLEVHGTTGSLRMAVGGCVVTPPGQEVAVVRREPAYVTFYRQMSEAARSGQRFGASLNDCVHVLSVLDAAYRSAAAGVTVTVADALETGAGETETSHTSNAPAKA